MATIKDVARHVGLSVTTVSRALNNYDDVAEATRERIRAAARSLDYHPNAAARSLQGSQASAIGLVIPLVLHRSYDAFWIEFIGGVAAVSGGRGLDLVLTTADINHGEHGGLQRLVQGRRVDGLIACDIRRDDSRISYMQKRKLPFVAFGRTVNNQSYSFIDVDGAAGVMQAMEHLIQLGHRRIAYLGVDPDFGFSHFRFSGYNAALARAGLPHDAALVRHGLTEATVPSAMSDVLALPERPTAIFAAADFLALAALKAIRGAGLSVPADLSVAVFDDNLLVQHADPPLTAISQPNRRLGEEAASLLLNYVAQPALPLAQRLVVPTLITRASTAPPRVT